MGTTHNHGFTIIETMLFLAVTGLLAIGVLVGSGVAIGQQRYQDSVNTLKSNLQQQYSEVSNTVNGRSGDWECNSAGVATEAPLGEARGTSECVLMGRLVTITDGTTLTASNVIGYRPISPVGANDIAELAAYNMTPSSIDQEVLDINWQAVIVRQHTATPAELSILILRSPLSGTVKTFIVEGATVPPNLNTFVSGANQSTSRVLCVAAPQGTFVGSQMGVKIDAFASNQGAVSIPVETDALCGV